MYEITFISKDEIDSSVKKIITSQDGKIVSESTLGRKKFAYPIGKEQSGCYLTYVFECDPEKIEIINKKVALEKNIMRYLLIQKITRKSGFKKERKAPEKAEEAKEQDIIAPKEEAKVKEEIAPAPVKKTTKKATKEKKTVAAKPVKKTKSGKTVESKEIEVTETERLKALDDKLSELLKE
jgi:small subunit ribosomal protein S6